MLQLTTKDIVFSFLEGQTLTTTIGLKNLSPINFISYKIKTTLPDLFGVTPSKGILQPGQSRIVEFKTNKPFTRGQAKQIVQKEKFLVQAIIIPDMKKQQQIQQLWLAYRNDPTKVQSTRLRLIIEGVDALGQLRASLAGQILSQAAPLASQQVGTSPVTSYIDNNLFKTAAMEPPNLIVKPSYQTPENVISRLDQLTKQEQRLVQLRDQAFSNANKVSSGAKSKSILPKLLLFAILFVFGMLISKKWIKKPIQVHTVQTVQTMNTIHTVTQVPIVKNDAIKSESFQQQRLNPNQKLIITHDDGTQTQYTNDKSEPVTVTIKTVEWMDGTKKIMIV